MRRKKLQHATKSRRFYKEGDSSRERVMVNRSKSIQELKKVTTCDRCGALGHWEDECPLKGHRRRSSPSDRSIGSGRIRKQRAQERGHREAKARAKVKLGESSLKRHFQLNKCTVIQKKEYQMNVPLGWPGQCWIAERQRVLPEPSVQQSLRETWPPIRR